MFHLAAIRQLALQYEEHCLASFMPCSDPGFLSFIELEKPEIPASEHSGAVNLMTYHGSKGLEWPVVIQASLFTSPAAVSLFDLTVGMKSGALFDLSAPLANRVIFALYWPFGAHEVIENLDAHMQASDSYKKRLASQRAEIRRLMYVGMTRAKEKLVLLKEGKKDFDPDSLLGTLEQNGKPVLEFPGTGWSLKVGGVEFPCVQVDLDMLPADVPEPVNLQIMIIPAAKPLEGESRPLYLQPSKMSQAVAQEDGQDLSIRELIEFGSDLLLNRNQKDEESNAPRRDHLGTAIHLFMGSDDPTRSKDERLKLADSIIERFAVRSEITAEALVEASTRFYSKMEALWPGQRVHREVPIEFELDGSIVRGSMDAFLLTPGEAVIIDHKASLKRADQAADVLSVYSTQMKAYIRAVSRAYPDRKVRAFLHNPDGWLAEIG